MAIELVSKFAKHVDEQFAAESKISLITNQDYDWTGAHTVKVYKVTTAPMNDYDRQNSGSGISRYGTINELSATTQEMILKKDRSFTYSVDKLNEDETLRQVAAASSLARQQREVIIPEIDTYVLNEMVKGAGTKADKVALTAENIYTKIMEAGKELDNNMVPDDSRYLVVTPDIYMLMKQNKDFMTATDIAQEMKIKGVIAMIDGVTVIKVPANRVPNKFGFMMVHPSATVAPKKLEEFKIHADPQFISGSLVEGRIVYDAFILDNKKKGIYYQPLP